MSEEEEFIIPNMGHTMGNLICDYLTNNPKVLCAGYKVNRDQDLVIKVGVEKDLVPSEVLTDAVKACKEDINQLMASWATQVNSV